VSKAELQAYQSTVAETDEQREWMKDGYDSFEPE
jgi:hypothetical protein